MMYLVFLGVDDMVVGFIRLGGWELFVGDFLLCPPVGSSLINQCLEKNENSKSQKIIHGK